MTVDVETVRVEVVGPSPRRLALSPVEAAAALGISRDSFDRYLMPELRVVRKGRLVLVPVRELEAWLDREAALTLGATA